MDLIHYLFELACESLAYRKRVSITTQALTVVHAHACHCKSKAFEFGMKMKEGTRLLVLLPGEIKESGDVKE